MESGELREQVRARLELDQDALLARLADEVSFGVGPLDPERKRSIARVWLDAQRDRLRLGICGEEGIQTLREAADDDRLELVAAVADLVASITGTLPAATVAVLLVRTGLDRLCG